MVRADEEFEAYLLEVLSEYQASIRDLSIFGESPVAILLAELAKPFGLNVHLIKSIGDEDRDREQSNGPGSATS